MKASELRVGNYFYCTRDHCDIQVLETDFHPTIYSYYKPVPLTEEWLIKFGFDTDLEGTVYKNIRNAFIYGDVDSNGIYIIRLVDEENQKEISVLAYVHQLQNLYHALTGEELIIKETSES